MVEMSILLLTMTLGSPLTTGAAAVTFGRPFWKWFLIGACLPGLSFFVLFWVTRHDDEEPTSNLEVTGRPENTSAE